MAGPHRMLAGGARWRPLPLLLAILSHGAALGLLLAAWQPALESAAAPVLVYMLPLSLSRPTTAPPASPARALQRSGATPTAPPPIIAPEPSAPSTAIQLPPPDWQLELQRSVRNVVEEQSAATQKPRSLDSRPKVLQLPRDSTEPNPGDVAILPNGDLLITFAHGWTCLHSQPALDEAFSVWAKHRPAKCTKKGDGAGGGKIELQRRDYLREPLPDPPAAD